MSMFITVFFPIFFFSRWLLDISAAYTVALIGSIQAVKPHEDKAH